MIIIPKICLLPLLILSSGGWSGGAMALGNLPVPGRPTIWMVVRPTALAVGAGGGCLDPFSICLPLFGRRPDMTDILSQRAVKPKTTNQPS